MTDKKGHELNVFLGFAAAAGIDLQPSSSVAREPGEPDLLCMVDGQPHYFEVSEILWEPPGQPGETLAKGHHRSQEASRRKAELMAEGRVTEANRIQTWGRGQYPPLGSLRQALERKSACKYETAGREVSLLLYYERQTPFEPFDLLFECTDVLKNLLLPSPFDQVWLYHHNRTYTVTFGDPAYESLRLDGRVPLSSFRPPESSRSVVGRIQLQNGELRMMFDSHYTAMFNSTLSALEGALLQNGSAS